MTASPMTRAMDDVFYETRDFNHDSNSHRFPSQITEKHFLYLLDWDNDGYLVCQRDGENNPVTSPRKLRDICVYKIVTNSKRLRRMDPSQLPTNVYPVLMTEAILLRRTNVIEWCVSAWPARILRLYDVIPLEDDITSSYLTGASDDSKISLVDAVVAGILKLRDVSNLKIVDFTRFDKDNKLCKELCRIPVLWMKPEDRTVENLHSVMSQSVALTKDKVQKFLNRISRVYSNMTFECGKKMNQITILVDLAIVVDDVPMGLSLQQCTPFKLACGRLWVKPIGDVVLSLANISSVIDTGRITHFEYEDPKLPHDKERLDGLIEALRSLINLFALSLPNSVDVEVNPGMAPKLHVAFLRLRHLSRLNLPYCNLKSHVGVLLGGLRRHMSYLNLKDCRLTDEDMYFLGSWRTLPHLRELNLSNNNIGHLDEVLSAILEKSKRITCFSVSFCSLSIHSQVLLAQFSKECFKLKVICLQGFVPLPDAETFELLRVFAQIKKLQKLVLFPESYAFPGINENERILNRFQLLNTAYAYLEMRGRSDLNLE